MPDIEKQIDRIYFSVFLPENGIVHVRITANDEIDLEQVKEIIACIGEITDGKKCPVLVSSLHFSAPTPEARAYLAKAESNPNETASAYIVKSLAEKLMVNGYLAFNRPARPTKMFMSEKKAIEWLKTFL